MKKIISLFMRNYDGDRLVRDEVVPGAEWVVAGEGVPTRKLDGTCCLYKDGILFKRYDVKKGKPTPSGFIAAQEPDEVTGHHPGWLPIGDGPEDRWHREAFEKPCASFVDGWTYELCGPKVQGNPERYEKHTLVPHGSIRLDVLAEAPRTFEALRAFFAEANVEGIVWWRDINDVDCDKVKIKAKDFGVKRGGS